MLLWFAKGSQTTISLVKIYYHLKVNKIMYRQMLLSPGTCHNDIWEGTIRAPAVIRWKRHLEGKQRVVSMVTVMDVMPTVLELLNYSTDSLELDGKSLLPLLFNTSKESVHNFVFHYLDIVKPAAVSFGPYKAIFTEIKGACVTYFNFLYETFWNLAYKGDILFCM